MADNLLEVLQIGRVKSEDDDATEEFSILFFDQDDVAIAKFDAAVISQRTSLFDAGNRDPAHIRGAGIQVGYIFKEYLEGGKLDFTICHPKAASDDGSRRRSSRNAGAVKYVDVIDADEAYLLGVKLWVLGREVGCVPLQNTVITQLHEILPLCFHALERNHETANDIVHNPEIYRWAWANTTNDMASDDAKLRAFMIQVKARLEYLDDLEPVGLPESFYCSFVAALVKSPNSIGADLKTNLADWNGLDLSEYMVRELRSDAGATGNS